MLSRALFQGTAETPTIRTSALLQDMGMLTGMATEILGKKPPLSL